MVIQLQILFTQKHSGEAVICELIKGENMKVSVVMTTYNGIRFLKEMLDSLKNQTRKIDEVIICDDRSTDNTVKFINEYIEVYNLKNWKITVNHQNLGWEKNFLNALNSANNDIIYPCDQDDVWHLDKIEKMTAAFEKNDNIWLLSSVFHSFCENGGIPEIQNPVPTETAEIVSRVVFNEKYYQILRPGCTMAFKKELLPLFVKNWKPGTPHDAVLWTIAALLRKLYIYDDTLIEYRRHDSNASNEIIHGYKYRVNAINRTIIINNWYLNSEYFDENKLQIVQNCTNWCDYRYKLIVEKKPFYWFKLFRYRKYYLNLRKYFGDIYYFFKSK